MNKIFPSPDLNILNNVQNGLAAGLSGSQLLQQLNGTHPIDIKHALLNADAHDVFERVFDGIKTDRPSFHEISREDNPSLSFWPFTSATVSRIEILAEGFSKVALLGVPSLFANLRSRSTSTILFDCDDYFFPEGSDGFFKTDVAGISSNFDNMFDLVIADPPWYPDEYHEWLTTAARITRLGGTVMFVLFPEGIRPSARAERKEILEFAKNSLSDVTIDNTKAQYETPSFEQVQLICNGIRPINWRIADLVIGRTKEKKQIQNSNVTREYNAWQECRVGSGRLFVDTNPNHFSPSENFLVCADVNSRFLPSPSRRSPARIKSNILSSRGHGLYCSDPAKFVQLIEKVKCAVDIDIIANSVDAPSSELFRLVMRELWGRFIWI